MEYYENWKKQIMDHGEITEELDPDKRVEFAEGIASKMIEIDKDKPQNLLPIYDSDGNLLWPKQMSYAEVKKFVEEMDRKKEKVDAEINSA